MTDPRPFWHPDKHRDRRPFLALRGTIAARLRAWFGTQNFVEVETAILQRSPGNEAHLHAFATDRVEPHGGSEKLYLRTSPEFSCKKLLAAGEPRVYEFARSFRNRERGALHAPEFTMLEWYRAGETYESLMQDAAALMAEAARAGGTAQFTFKGRTIDPFAPPERLSVREAFRRHAGIDLPATYDGLVPDRDRLATAAQSAGVRIVADDTWLDIFSRILGERIEPHLGNGRATILYDYPAVQSALARPKAEDPRLAERFELFACGVELLNAFGELNDAAEQRRRLDAEMEIKARVYGERYPLDEDFLAALAMMPPACGAAMGFDRLVMLATGAAHIDQVVWTPVVQ
jgi:lysyl-tRNA synthetase class 2